MLRSLVGSEMCIRDRSKAWAGSVANSFPTQKLGDFMTAVEQQQTSGYVFDQSIPTWCHKLARELVIPKYFSNDLLQHQAVNWVDPKGGLPDNHPSLFVGGPGTGAQMHVDSAATHFWMALLQGRKEWKIFDTADHALLCPDYFNGHRFQHDAFQDENFTACPPARYARPYTFVQNAGELLFIPGGSPHQVRNLERSLAVSMNYVDHTNVHRAIREIELDGAGEQTIETFKRLARVVPQVQEPVDQSWRDFKRARLRSWWRNPWRMLELPSSTRVLELMLQISQSRGDLGVLELCKSEPRHELISQVRDVSPELTRSDICLPSERW
eukprot:TRINITY_DN22529_c0_g1_i1.p1 TRINITY_DN22529_c0_g1~~TRINITY_DN22529_c0_g1_i1.p1  ORF type:complete len:362 (+),score=91.97 TRINITY_DN22529_c0_g1_i1:109-1086(+)